MTAVRWPEVAPNQLQFSPSSFSIFLWLWKKLFLFCTKFLIYLNRNYWALYGKHLRIFLFLYKSKICPWALGIPKRIYKYIFFVGAWAEKLNCIKNT